MDVHQLLGLILTIAGGLVAGTSAWPVKVMRTLKYEHWGFVNSAVGLLLLPWALTLVLCPNALSALATLPGRIWLQAGLLSLAWGIANVLAMLCLVRIGVALSVGLLTGIGLPIGVLVPVLLKGSGRFKDAPDLNTAVGHVLLVAVAVMLLGVVMTAVAGVRRNHDSHESGRGFTIGMAMAAVAGVLQVGLSLSFVYTQGAIADAVKARGASEAAAGIAVWAVCLLGGGLVNVLYPLLLLRKNRSWGGFAAGRCELPYALVMGVTFVAFVNLMGGGMRLLGALGASVGFGVYQGLQLTGSQLLGFATGEWRESRPAPRRLMIAAIAVLLAAVALMAWANAQARA